MQFSWVVKVVTARYINKLDWVSYWGQTVSFARSYKVGREDKKNEQKNDVPDANKTIQLQVMRVQ